ncbi:MAG: hypothetical protein ACKOCB_08650 [Planctomycetia bacterium]
MPGPDIDAYTEHASKLARSPHYMLRRALAVLEARGRRWRQVAAPRAGHAPGLAHDPAPLAVVHVDLSVVPPGCTPPPGRHASTLNAAALDIRRTRYTQARLLPGDAWRGPVIVKSVLNHRGLPEHVHRRHVEAGYRWRQRLLRLAGIDGTARACPPYAIYRDADEVPPRTWADPDLLVERFLPGAIAVPVVKHRWDFLLDVDVRKRSTFSTLRCEPGSVLHMEPFDHVPEAVRRVRHGLGLEMGSIDFFVVDGEAFVIDANKTTTADESLERRFPFVARYMHAIGERVVAAAQAGRWHA